MQQFMEWKNSEASTTIALTSDYEWKCTKIMHIINRVWKVYLRDRSLWVCLSHLSCLAILSEYFTREN